MLPMWLSMFFRGAGGCGPTSGASCAWAKVNPARTKVRIALKKCTRFKSFMVGILNRFSMRANDVQKPCPPANSFSLEVEVKTQQQFAGIHVQARCPNHGPGPILMQPVVLVVPGKTGPAGHERVVAVADRVGSNVSQVGGSWTGVSARPGRRIERAVGLL